jgi:hypothetical protein
MNLNTAIQSSLKKVTAEFTRAKMQAYRQREDRVSQWQIDRWEKQDEERQLKAAAYKVIPQAYAAASDNGQLPAKVRQIYYQVRPLVMELTGGKTWKNSDTFTQGVFFDYVRDHPRETQDWDVVFDARGHLTEPHVRRRIGIGTLEVRSYVSSWEETCNLDFAIDIDDTVPTSGPTNRYQFALFIEKEGFDSLLERAKISERYDLAIFSSKGQSNIATRKLVDELSALGVTILVAHDLDIAGFTIAHWLWHDNERYQFRSTPKVIDLGLRLADVERLALQSEEQVHRQQKDPAEKFFDWGDDEVTEEEAEFLRGKYSYGHRGWVGQRVELNALTSRQFIDWLEEKLRKAGVKKVIPDAAVLGQAWRRALWLAQVRERIAEVSTEPCLALPKNLEADLRRGMKSFPEFSWDQVIVQIAEKHLSKNKSHDLKPLLLTDQEKKRRA